MSLEKEMSTSSVSLPNLSTGSDLGDSSEKLESTLEKGVTMDESAFSDSAEEDNPEDDNPGDDVQDEDQDEDQDIEEDQDVEEDQDEDQDVEEQEDENVLDDIDDDDDVSDLDEDELGNVDKLQKESKSKTAASSTRPTEKATLETMIMGDSETYTGSVEDYSTDEEDEEYLQKFNTNVGKNYILDFHPEKKIHNYEEVKKFSKIKRDKQNRIVDPFHKTTPILTKYERTKVLGQRAKQIDEGASPMIDVESNIIDGYIIALEELNQKKLPFIIRRPVPNGGVEYWPVRELDCM